MARAQKDETKNDIVMCTRAPLEKEITGRELVRGRRSVFVSADVLQDEHTRAFGICPALVPCVCVRAHVLCECVAKTSFMTSTRDSFLTRFAKEVKKRATNNKIKQ